MTRPILSAVLTLRVGASELTKIRYVVAQGRRVAKRDGFRRPSRSAVLRDVLALGLECALARGEVDVAGTRAIKTVGRTDRAFSGPTSVSG